MKSSAQSEFSSHAISYSASYSVGMPYNERLFTVVEKHSLLDLFERYKNILWEDGKHKYNVTSFIGEIHEILLGERFSAFDQSVLDDLIGKLRERGNSNATINRKMAALSKLLRKAYKMGDIHSLPEFRRQKERAGRIRFLEPEEEDRLFGCPGAMRRQLPSRHLPGRHGLPAR
jgi:hypothetical protein